MSFPLRSHRLRRAAAGDVADAAEQAFVAGDEAAVRLVYERYGALVHTFCRRTVGPTVADDVTQEVFLTAWRMRDRFDPQRGSLAGWLIGITRNKLLEQLRRRQLHLIDDARTPELPAKTAPDDVAALGERMLLAAALETLPERTRSVITMAYCDDLTHQEISERTSLPLGTVKSDVRRGLARLRRELEYADG
jgi:RNA polymerase sigma factor (sigma-70 family)